MGQREYEQEGALVPTLSGERGNRDASTGPGPLAFSAKDYAQDSGDLAPTMRAMNHVHGHANGGGQVAVAFGRNNTSGPIAETGALLSHGGPHGHMDFETETFIAQVFKPSHSTRGKDGGPSEAHLPVTADTNKGDQEPVVLVFDPVQATHPENRSAYRPGDPAPTLAAEGRPAVANVAQTLSANQMESRGATAGNNPGVVNPVLLSAGVRRLTPREWERLQGFPDDWTRIMWRGQWAKDGPRYRSIGNAMAVPVMAWVGDRLQLVDEVIHGSGGA